MRLSASRSCLVAGAKPRRVLPRAGAITSRFESLEKLWRRRVERTPFGPSRRDSNPCFSLERASPWLVISPTSPPGATARCHSRPRSASRMPPLIHDLDGSLHGVRSRKLVRALSGRDPQRSHRGTSSYDSVHLSHARSDNSFLLLEPGGDEALQHVTLRDNVRQQRGHDGHGGGGH